MSPERRSRRVRFAGGTGHTLVGQLELPGGEARAWALFAPCFTCLKDTKAVAHISRTLAEHGIGVLRFDFTGLGESEGDFAATTFSTQLDDLEAAADFLHGEADAPRLLVGMSLGGAAALAGAGRLDSVRAVATVNAPSDTAHLSDLLLERAPELGEHDSAEVTLLGRTTRIGRAMVDDLRNHDIEAAAAGLGRALLIFHAPGDQVVGAAAAERLFRAARHPKSFIAVDGSDHLLLSGRADPHFVGEVMAAWAKRYISTPRPPAR